MSTSRPRLTAAVQQSILAYVRAGGYPQVAAEAAGVPRDVFEQWLREGERSGGPPRYRAFALALRQAQAQARLGAEVSARDARPLDWLRNGPGRQTSESAGWTAPARASDGPTPGRDEVMRELLTSLIPHLLHTLAPYPEARTALAAAVPELLRQVSAPTENLASDVVDD